MEHKTATELGYKVGDRFRVAREVFGYNLCGTSIGQEIVFSEDDGSTIPYFQSESSGDRRQYCLCFAQLDPITTNGENITMSVSVQEIQDLKLSDDDRLLHEAGFINRDGSLTDAGKEVVTYKTFVNTVKNDLVADVKAINKAKAAKK